MMIFSRLEGQHQLPIYCLLLLIYIDAKIKKNVDGTSIKKKKLYSQAMLFSILQNVPCGS